MNYAHRFQATLGLRHDELETGCASSTAFAVHGNQMEALESDRYLKRQFQDESQRASISSLQSAIR
jgi:hypothetical protein